MFLERHLMIGGTITRLIQISKLLRVGRGLLRKKLSFIVGSFAPTIWRRPKNLAVRRSKKSSVNSTVSEAFHPASAGFFMGHRSWKITDPYDAHYPM